jgi:hypothetical protein
MSPAGSIPVTDVGALKNELRKYKHGKKLEISQFNQAARLAWLGRVALSPLDPEDPECKAWLLHLEQPEGLAGQIMEFDAELLGRIHVLDGEQGRYLAEILRAGFESRVRDIEALAHKDFYLEKYFRPEVR